MKQADANFLRLAAFCAIGALFSAGVVALTPPTANPYWFVGGFWLGLAFMFTFMVYAIDWTMDDTKEDEDDD